jgi:hypothetical protein
MTMEVTPRTRVCRPIGRTGSRNCGSRLAHRRMPEFAENSIQRRERHLCRAGDFHPDRLTIDLTSRSVFYSITGNFRRPRQETGGSSAMASALLVGIVWTFSACWSSLALGFHLGFQAMRVPSRMSEIVRKVW